ELPALLNGADLFVFPSLYEGFGLPPLEAMACGTPVIASNTTSLPEVVGDAGLLVDPYQAREIAAAMYRVVTDRNLWRTLREKGLARARTFSGEKTARSTFQAYEEAVKRSRHKGRSPPRQQRKTAFRLGLRSWAVNRLHERALSMTQP